MGKDIIKIENLTKYYRKIRGIDNVTFSVRKGEIFGYLGPNGAGKTTTIRLLLGLLMYKKGKIEMFGLDHKKNLGEILKRSGYLPGEFSMYENLTAKQYLTFFSNLNGKGNLSSIEPLAERFNLNTELKISTLSTGNIQKVGIIQAFMSKPELIILDEPTRGLDPLMRQEFYTLLRETKSRGGTVLLSSHVLSEVEKVCDRVGIVRNGTVVASEDILTLRKKKYKNVEIFCRDEIDIGVFENIENVSNLNIAGNTIKCHIDGDLDPLIRIAQKFYIIDISSEHPGLEETFMKFYNGE